MQSFERRRLLALTIGDDSAASSRVRIGAPLASLQAKGWRISRVTAAQSLWPARIVIILVSLRPTITVLQKVVPPGWFTSIIALSSQRLIFECDDAIQIDDESGSNSGAKTAHRLRALLPRCDRIIVSNAQLGDDLRRLGANEIVVFPGPAPRISASGTRGRKGLVWLGSPSTVKFVRDIAYPALQILRQPTEIHVIGAERDYDGGLIKETTWSVQKQTLALENAQVGLAPQLQSEWDKRKAFYKVLEYLAASIVPVVPNHPAVATLLGDELDTLAVTARDDSPTAWAEAIDQALSLEVDDRWLTARNCVFARWSAERLGEVILG